MTREVPRINIIHSNETNNNTINSNSNSNNNYNSISNSNNQLTVDNRNLLRLNEPQSLLINNARNNNNNNKKNPKSKIENPWSIFRRAVPVMSKPLAIICCITNILIPGSGTLISAFSILCCGTKHRYENRNILAFFINFLAFLLQLCSACIIFGWIWSIKYGIYMVHLAGDKKADDTELPMYCRRHSSVDTTVLVYQPTRPRLSLNQL